jgi:type IV pilus assembly protein PilM
MKSTAFGLDIGTTTMKIVWLDREKDTYTYLSCAAVPTTVQGLQSESTFDQQEMAKIINQLITDAKIATNNVNIALPENHVYTKVIDMPVLSDKELSSAIYWEAEQYIPAALDTMALDWSILQKPTAVLPEDKMQVLLVAAPLKLINKYKSILELAGLNIVSIETEVLSTIRGLLASDTSPTSLLVSIGSMSTTLSIVQRGIIMFNYSVPLGGLALTRAIASDFGLNVVQAEEYKRVYGMSDKNFGGKLGKAIEPILTSILSEVKKAMSFYNDKYKNMPVSQVLLTGGGASLPGITLYFAQNISIETAIANPWKMRNIQRVPPQIEAKGPEFTVAVGLALKEYE